MHVKHFLWTQLQTRAVPADLLYTITNRISSLSTDGLCAFTSFLVSEFSEENIAFYFACEEYRNTKSPAKLPAKAQKIYDEFIGSDAPREVNKHHISNMNLNVIPRV